MTAELDFARRVAVEAGAIVRAGFGRTKHVDLKGWADPVTAADRASEAYIRAEITRSFPADAIHGEEEGFRPGLSERVWLVDPLDGTPNFAGGMPAFAVCLTLLRDGVPVLNVTHDPMRGETFDAAVGGGARLNGESLRMPAVSDLTCPLVHVSYYSAGDHRLLPAVHELTRRVTSFTPHLRTIGSFALSQAWVACGRLHANALACPGVYDIVGGNLLIAEAGGLVTDLFGRPYEGTTRGLLAGSADVHRHLLALDLGAALP
jgi:fructose-1,6-bisphosphatase/inositol monophosphatase family enzyme